MKSLRFSGQGGVGSSSSHGHRGLFVVALATSLIFCLLWNAARGDSLCEGCLNGGKLLMPNNIFGYCRCKCFGDYKGPKCQFLYKRSPPATKFLSSAAAAIEEAIASGGGGGSKANSWALLPGDGSKAVKTANWILPQDEVSKATDDERHQTMPKRMESEERNQAQQQQQQQQQQQLLRGLLDRLSDIARNENAQDIVSY